MNETEKAIDDALRRALRKRRRIAAGCVLIAGMSFAAAWLLLSALLDRWIPQRRGIRLLSGGVACLAVAVTAGRFIQLIFSRGYDAIRAARLAEASDSEWGERLSTAVTQMRLPAGDRGAPLLVAALSDGIARELRIRSPASRINVSAARPVLTLFGFVVIAWLVALLLPSLDVPVLIERQLLPWADVEPVTNTKIDLLHHAPTILQGQSLTIVADLNRDVGAVLLNIGPDLQHLRPLAMERTSGYRYSVTVVAPQSDFVYRVTAGDAMSPRVFVGVVRTPGVSALAVDLDCGDGRPVRHIPDCDGNLRVPAGTTVIITLRTTDPVRSAVVHAGTAVIATSAGADKRNWKAAFVARKSAPWSIELVSDRGANGQGPPDMQIRVVPGSASQPATRP